MRRLALALLATGLLGSCARNAVLEIELTLPPQPAGTPPRYAVVLFDTEGVLFTDGWDGAGHYPGARLGAMESSVAYSVETSHPGPLLVKVQFCESEDCSTDDPMNVSAVWYRLEQPFYIGQRTRWRARIDLVGGALPPPPRESDVIDVDKCQIQGCIDSTTTETSFCRLSGEHFCE